MVYHLILPLSQKAVQPMKSLKKIMENPVLSLLGLIVFLVLFASFFHFIVKAAAFILVGVIIYMVAKRLIGGKPHEQTAGYCRKCGDLYHGSQHCNHCNCASS